jgi:hypothetical protein
MLTLPKHRRQPRRVRRAHPQREGDREMVQHLVGDELVEFGWIEALVVEVPAGRPRQRLVERGETLVGQRDLGGSDADGMVRDVSLHAAADERTVAGDGQGRPGRELDRCRLTANPVAPCASRAPYYWSGELRRQIPRPDEGDVGEPPDDEAIKARCPAPDPSRRGTGVRVPSSGMPAIWASRAHRRLKMRGPTRAAPRPASRPGLLSNC